MNIHKLNKLILFIEKYFNIKIEKTTFIYYLYHLNLLIYNFYLIYKNTRLSYKQKIKKISELRDTDNNKFLNLKQSKFILDNYGHEIFNFYSELYRLRSEKYNMKGGNKIDHSIKYLNKNINQISNYLDNPKIKKKGKLIFNWIFFPIWSLENSSMGYLITIPLDIISIILDNIDIIMEALAPVLPVIISVLLDLGQAVPAYGTAISAVAIPFNFLEEPLEEILANFTDIIGMFINISRKEWSLAYMSALSCIPLFADVMDSVLTNLYVNNKNISYGNKQLNKFNKIVYKITENINNYEIIIKDIIENPSVILNPQQIIKQYISKSGKNDDKLIEKLSNNVNLISDIKNNYSLFLQNPDIFIDKIIKPHLDNSVDKKKMLNTANILLSTINNFF